MNGRTKSIAQRPTCLRCRETDKRQARTRGLCPSCYATTSRRVRRGQKTWDELEAANLVAKKLAFPLDAKKPAGRWLNHQVFESHEHGACRIQTAAAERSGLPRTCLRRWASGPCRHNDDEPILTLLVRHPIRMADQFVPVFPDNVIGPVAESYRKSKAKAEPDPDDDAKPPSNDDDALLSTSISSTIGKSGKAGCAPARKPYALIVNPLRTSLDARVMSNVCIGWGTRGPFSLARNRPIL
jgi:hypothetical protein